MKPLELLRLIWINMVENKFKVLTTSLGIVVGAVTIVLVIAIGQGGEAEAARGYSGLSADTVYVNVNYETAGFNMERIEKLTEEILEHIKEENPYLSGMYLRANNYKEITFGREKEYTSLNGVTPGWDTISGFQFQEGGDFQDEKSIIIGNGLAEKYFPGGDALGSKLKIGDHRYVITGVLKRNADGLQGLDSDSSIFMPYEAMVEDGLLDEFAVPQAVGKAKDLASVKLCMKGIKNTLDYYLQNGNTYMVEDAGSRIDAATQSARTMKMLLVSVAAIVFVVGGIGIMNVLFVTIKERTKEIGVLMALGSTRGSILVQFLLESVAIGIFSGGVGVLLSFFALNLMGKTEIPVLPSAEGMLVAFLFSVCTSALFGFYPAFKASRLEPVNALNYE